MMKRKRMAAWVMAVVTLFCMTTAAAAAPEAQVPAAQAQQAAKIADAKKLAYMDMAGAPEEMQARILEARKILVNSESWVVDGMDATVKNSDGTETPIPHFSDLFPGWDYAEIMKPSAAAASEAAGLVVPDAELAAKIAGAKKYAYIDLKTAPNEMWVNRVLNARRLVIDSESWVADGFDAVVVHADGTETKLPHFSELFPEDWELPVDQAAAKAAAEAKKAEQGQSRFRRVSCYLDYPDPDHFTSPFYQLVHQGSALETTVQQLPAGGTCNLGYTDMETGVSFLQRSRMEVGDTLRLSTNRNTEYFFGVRGSTFDVPGTGWFFVESVD